MPLPPATNCPDCCTCPSVEVVWRSRSASRSKCGATHPFTACAGKVWRRIQFIPPPPGGFYDNSGCAGDGFEPIIHFAGSVVPYTTRQWYPDGADGESPGVCQMVQSGSSTFGSFYQWQDEDTLEDVEARALSALPGDYPNSTGGSYRNASGSSASIREAEYAFKFKVPLVNGGNYFTIRWTERFTPLDGGDPVDTDRCVAWDGVVPSGYDPADNSTWPQINASGSAGWEHLDIPEENGTLTVVNVEASCDPSDAC